MRSFTALVATFLATFAYCQKPEEIYLLAGDLDLRGIYVEGEDNPASFASKVSSAAARLITNSVVFNTVVDNEIEEYTAIHRGAVTNIPSIFSAALKASPSAVKAAVTSYVRFQATYDAAWASQLSASPDQGSYEELANQANADHDDEEESLVEYVSNMLNIKPAITNEIFQGTSTPSEIATPSRTSSTITSSVTVRVTSTQTTSTSPTTSNSSSSSSTAKSSTRTTATTTTTSQSNVAIATNLPLSAAAGILGAGLALIGAL